MESTKPMTLTSREVYKGKIFDIRVDQIREGDVEYEREIVVHKGSAVIVPVFDDSTIALVRQYRHATGEYMLELPAGGIEEGETFEQAAVRELEEEIGVIAGKIEKITEFYVSPGFLTEKMHVFLATDLTEVGQKLESDELIGVERYSFAATDEMIRTGMIADAKTIVGLTLAKR